MPEPIATPAPAAPAAGAPAAPAAKPAEGAKPEANEPKYKVKVNGKEEEWTQAQLIERAQKSAGAEEAMKKADALDKAFNNFVSNAQDPEKLLGLLQHPSLKYDEAKQEVLVTKLLSSKSPKILHAVKKWLWENEIQPATMDPKERELAELRAAKEKYEREATERKQQEEQTARQIAVAKKWNEFRVSIGEALKAESLPQAESVVARVARYALLQSRAKKPVDIADAVKRVKADLQSEYETRLQGLTEDNILDHVPAGIAEMINKAFLKRLKGGTPAAAPAPEPAKDERPFEEVLRDVQRGKKVFQE
jgi:hypothetical protein